MTICLHCIRGFFGKTPCPYHYEYEAMSRPEMMMPAKGLYCAERGVRLRDATQEEINIAQSSSNTVHYFDGTWCYVA